MKSLVDYVQIPMRHTTQDRIDGIIRRSCYPDLSIHCICDNCSSGADEPCLQPYFKTGLEHNVFASKSEAHGIGLFARKTLKVKDIICLYSGNLVPENTGSMYIAEVSVPEGKIFIDGQDVENFSGRWINHSIRPNAQLVHPIGGILQYKKRFAIFVECTKDIYNGQEIFIDYGIEYFLEGGVLDATYEYGYKWCKRKC